MKKNIFVILVLFSTCFLFSKDIITIGTEQNEGELIYPQDVKEGPDGNIYISDQKDYFIKVYSPTGKYMFRMGGKGEGPGQMKRMGSFGFYSDRKTLFFTEYFMGHQWITNMKLNGKFDGVFKLDIKKRYGLSNTISLSDNKYISEINYAGDIKKKSDYFEYRYLKAVVIIDKNGRVKKDILKRKYIGSISMIDDGADITIPYIPKFLWIKINDKIIFADGLSTKLKVFDLTGEKTGEILTPLSIPEKVTNEDLNIWRKEFKQFFSRRNKAWFHRFGKAVDKYKKSIYEFKPNIREMSLSHGGNILIGEVPKSNKDKTNFWLLTPKGKVIKSFAMKARGIIITKSFIFFKSEDEDENTIVNCLIRKGTEKSDLLRLIKYKKDNK